MYSGFGAGALSTQLEIYRWEDHFSRLRAARAQSNLHAQNAALQGLVQRLADYGRYVEQQHNSLLAEAKKLDAQRCQQINAQLDEIDGLRQEIAKLRRSNTRYYEAGANLARDRDRHLIQISELFRRIADLEVENAKLRQASPTD